MEWIDVNDRLPDIGVEVLVLRPTALDWGDDVVAIDKRVFDKDKGYPDQYGKENLFDRSHHVTGWMPLPKAPKQ